MVVGPEQRIDPGEGNELIMPHIDKDSSQPGQPGIGGPQAPVLDMMSFEHLSGEEAWHRSLVYPA